MNYGLLNSEIQQFINDNLSENISKLAFQKNPYPQLEWKTILNQIEAKAKSRKKLPTWFATKNIIFPTKISIEQTSSEITAQYKSLLVGGTNIVDLSGGFGVDALYFSKKVKQVFHCEIDTDLSQIVAHNFEALNVSNIDFFCGDSSEFLKQSKIKFDWIYVDPSRRSEQKGKVFMLKDCLPNVPDLLDMYFQYSNRILIKTAPILDITAGIAELKHIKNIHIVAVENEVKEILWEIDKDFNGNITIKTSNILKDKSENFEFNLNDQIPRNYDGKILKYLYEPNAAIMKSGGFDSVSTTYFVSKLQQHSHLYTSNDIIDFPGRRFEIIEHFDYNKAEMKRMLQNKKINITTRNFPETVADIRTKWKIADGGDTYCFFTTDYNDNKIVLICNKI